MKLGIEGMNLKIIRALCDKLITNIILNWDKTETISSKVKKEPECLLFLLPFNIVLEFLDRNKTGKRNKRNLNRKGRRKIILI
jgi:hypothetical protein